MTCDEIQQSLLQGYDLDATTAAHLSRCAACAAVEEKLVSLDRAVRSLPAPVGSAAARDRFLAQLATIRQPVEVSRPPVLFRIARSRWAVAAVLALAVGGGTWAFLEHRYGADSKTVAVQPSPSHVNLEAPIAKNTPVPTVPLSPGPAPARSTAVPPSEAPLASNTPTVVPTAPTPVQVPAPAPAPAVAVIPPMPVPDHTTHAPVNPEPAPVVVAEVLGLDEDVIAQLVSHNVELSELPSPEQRRTAYKGATALRQKARTAKLSPGARKVADALLSDSEWIAEHNDPLATADRFGDVADLLVDRMNAPGTSPDAVSKLGQTYYLVLDRGISQNLNRAGAAGNLSPDHKKKLARLAQNHERLQHRLETLMEKYPNATRQQILKAIEAARLQHRKKMQGQPTPPAKP